MPVYPAVPGTPGLPGALITEDYQYQFRELLFGAGTDFVTTEVSGLLGSATARDQDVDKAHGHGVIPGVLLYGKRITQFNMSIRGDSPANIEAKLDVARATFQAPRIRTSKIPEPLVFRRPGAGDRVLYVRCTKRDFPSNYKTARGLAIGSVELQAADPLIYSLNENTTLLSLGIGAVTGTIGVSGGGSHADGTGPILTIEGPATDPIIQNDADDGRAIRLDVAIGINDAVRIHVTRRVVEYRTGLAGPWVRNYGIVANDNQWWNILPGVNDITYQRTGSAATSTLQIDWQDAWS